LYYLFLAKFNSKYFGLNIDYLIKMRRRRTM